MARNWEPDQILGLMHGYQAAAVLGAAGELDLFGALAGGPATAEEVAGRIGGNRRGTAVLLDALGAIGLLEKREGRYAAAPGVGEVLTEGGARSVLAMVRHQVNCMRRWDQLAAVVKSGRPAARVPGILGPEGDQASFIEAMDNISRTFAAEVVAATGPLRFRHLLDVGGASGTYTIAWLGTDPEARATLFDLPAVIPLARKRLAEAGMAERVRLEGGDFASDPLPGGADLAWVSAIVHQNSREENRRLFAKVFAALVAGGRIAIRDIVMDPSRVSPVAGALFAVNMLVGTAGGGTFTFDELREDLEAAGFVNAVLVRRDERMNSIVVAEK